MTLSKFSGIVLKVYLYGNQLLITSIPHIDSGSQKAMRAKVCSGDLASITIEVTRAKNHKAVNTLLSN